MIKQLPVIIQKLT